jgi:agmatine deiminase
MRLLLPLLIILISVSARAQDLPRYMTPAEQAIWPNYLHERLAKESLGFTNPPSSPVRTMAEWEEIDAICITWTSYQSILAQIVAAAQSEAKVIINCSDSNSVKSYLTNAGITPYNCMFIQTSFNSVWIRDYGPHTVYVNDVDSLLLVDWIYNRPRPADDAIPEVLANKLGLPLYQTTQSPHALVNTGGNFLPDGFGLAFSSNLVLDENPSLTTTQVDNILNLFMGINPYVHLTNLPYDGIHHIDMHMKLLDEETLLMGEFPAGVSDGPQIETNLQYILANHVSAFGTPFRVVRIPMPASSTGTYPPSASYRTYTNGVFVNKKYIVPTYYQQWDTIALRILQENLPGYTVVPINCNSMISASGAIHCITKLIGTKNPLLISHKPVYMVYDTVSSISINAHIQHVSGIASAAVRWRTDSLMPWQSAPMTLSSAPDHTYTGYIPAQGPNEKIEYYIQAQAVSGKSQVRPITAPTGYWTCYVNYHTGLDESVTKPEMLLFPNPASEKLRLRINLAAKGRASIIILDMSGRTVYDAGLFPFNTGSNEFELDIRSLEAGIYLLCIDANGSSFTERFSKQ